MSRRTLVRISSFSTSSAQSRTLDTGFSLSGVVKLDKNIKNFLFQTTFYLKVKIWKKIKIKSTISAYMETFKVRLIFLYLLHHTQKVLKATAKKLKHTNQVRVLLKV